MNTTPILLLLLAASLVSAQVPGRNLNGKVPEVNQHCMDCICQASSSCDETLKCHSVVGGGGYLCGPYVVSWAYWYDGGRPGDRGKAQDFQTCLTNRTAPRKPCEGTCASTGLRRQRRGGLQRLCSHPQARIRPVLKG